MNKDASPQVPDELARPVSAFEGPIAGLIAQRMLAPPSRPGVLANADRFEIMGLLGSGGMGIVLLAQDPNTQKDVAIKMIKPDLVANQQVVHRFVKEAGHLQRLRHANLMPILEVSNRPQGPYFVMPYYDQGSLAKRIKPGQSLEASVILAIALQVAEGLLNAHQHGIIHRDLKPANILLAANDRACLADFGLARTMFNDTIVDVESQQCEGTAPYMSPGVAAGVAEDTRCDIYAFGALLYEMLTGNPPYQGASTKEIQRQILAGPPQPITELNPKADRQLVMVGEGAMARELRDRYADMADVVADLQRIKVGKAPVGPRGLRRVRPIPKILILTACVIGMAILGWRLWPEHHEPPPSPVVSKPPVPVPEVLTFSTLAGQAGVSGSVDGEGANARFNLPAGIAVDSAGNVYVADTGNHTIRKITPAGVVSTLAGLAGHSGSDDGTGETARFLAPFGVAVDQPGNLYVADMANDTIRKITPAGVVSTLAGLAGHPGGNDGLGAEARFRNPWGVAVDKGGNVYVADESSCTIRKITPEGEVSTFAGSPGSSGSADDVGAGARFNHPFAVAVDNMDFVYVADTGNDTIRKITPAGVVSTLAGLAGYLGSDDESRNNSRFWHPQGLAVDDAGDIYVADTENLTIRKITPSGMVTTLAGQAGSPAGATDGVGVNARFSHPNGVAVDHAGNVYVADTNNHTIRKGVPAASATLTNDVAVRKDF